MRSTIGKAKEVVKQARKIIPLSVDRRIVDAEPDGKSDLYLGIEILGDLLRYVRLPRSRADERLALGALRHILDNGPMTEKESELKYEIASDVAKLRQEDVRALLNWIEPERSRLGRLRQRFSTGERRHRLLFVLFALAFGPITENEIVVILQELGYLGPRRNKYSLLSWIPRFMVGGERMALVTEYFDLSRRLLFSSQAKRPRPKEVLGAFPRWGWITQLMHLDVWRYLWDFEGDPRFDREYPSPVHYTHTIEFALAYDGAFGRLRLRGGPVAWKMLKRLGYRDRRRPRPRFSIADLLVPVVIVALLGLAGWFFNNRVHEWNIETREYARKVIDRYGSNARPAHAAAQDRAGLRGADAHEHEREAR